jgi:hypothetical protein
MNDADFAVFYDNQPDYVAFRKDKEKQKEYRTLVDWKVRKLIGIMRLRSIAE